LGQGSNFTLPRGKKISILEQEAKYRSASPSPVTYQLKTPTNWGKGSVPLGRDKRVTEPEMIARRN